MLGSDAVALSSYRYSAQHPISLLENSERAATHHPHLADDAAKSQNLREDQVILHGKVYHPSLEAADGDKGYESDAAKSDAHGREFSEEEQQEIEELKDRDQEVRRHEQAHASVAGQYGSPPKYEYQTGPDGRRYAVGGSVDIDMSEVPGDPQATLEKARVVKRAALAPEEPSAQDRKVAREAEQMAVKAQKELSEQQLEQVKSNTEPTQPVQRPDETAAVDAEQDAIKKIAVEHVDFPTESIDLSQVSRYNTSRLEMGGYAGFRIEQLAMPSEYFAISGFQASVDLYV